jgi:hypothetical protein
VGTWTPVSVEAFGPNPKGLLIFEDNGRFSLQLMRAQLPKFASNKRNDGTAEENKEVVGGSIAYYGTYSMSGNELTFHTEGCTFPNWMQTDQKRSNVSISADELKYTNPAPSIGGPARYPSLEACEVVAGCNGLGNYVGRFARAGANFRVLRNREG